MISISKVKSGATTSGYLQSENIILSSSTSDSELDSFSDASKRGHQLCEGEVNKKADSLRTVHTVERKSREHSKRGGATGSSRRPERRSYDVASVGNDELIVNHLNGRCTSLPFIKDDSSNYIDDDLTDSVSSSSELVDSDDTGTIPDSRPKNRHFSKVLVVNRDRFGGSDSLTDNESESSDSHQENSSHDGSETDHADCHIVLTSLKMIDETSVIGDVQSEYEICLHQDTVNAKPFEDISDDDSTSNEIGNCIFVVGGVTDDDNSGVVLKTVRPLQRSFEEENEKLKDLGDHYLTF